MPSKYIQFCWIKNIETTESLPIEISINNFSISSRNYFKYLELIIAFRLTNKSSIESKMISKPSIKVKS